MSDTLRSMAQVAAFEVRKPRLWSATHDEILAGATSDVYFQRTHDLLQAAGRADARVTAEVFSRKEGVLAGVEEVLALLAGRAVEVWSLEDGSDLGPKEVVARLEGAYGEFGVFETALLGMLSSSSGWASAARDCKRAAGGRPVVSFGARHVHPAVASVLDRAAVIGGCDGCSTVLGARLSGMEPAGTVPHAAALIVGDTLELARLVAEHLPVGGRTVLVDTFQDEALEALRVALELPGRIEGVRLDTPSERGGVTPDLVAELRARLDQAGFSRVRIFCSGGLWPERIGELASAGADAFGVGHHISSAPALEMTMDIKEVDGKPVAKRGRIPGRTRSDRLVRRQ